MDHMQILCKRMSEILPCSCCFCNHFCRRILEESDILNTGCSVVGSITWFYGNPSGLCKGPGLRKLKAKSICYFLKLHKRKADILHVYEGLLRWSHLPTVNQTRERDLAQLRLRVLMAAVILQIPRGRTKKGLRRCCEACVVCTPLATNWIVMPIVKHICCWILY